MLKPHTQYMYNLLQKPYKNTRGWCDAARQHLVPHYIGKEAQKEQHQPGSVLCMQLVPRYQNLLHGAELVESQLKESFPEYLNAEIALRTVTDVSVAISWLKGSFFYIRVCML